MTRTEETVIPEKNIPKIGFGGSCYWCTEAVFQSLKGVKQVEQGFIASDGDNQTLSEAVIVHYDPDIIQLTDLTAVHLHTHNCTSQHSMREKYRSAIYTFNDAQMDAARQVLNGLQADFEQPVITEVLPCCRFELSDARYHNYYQNNPDKPFCQTYIHPKLQMIRERFKQHTID